MIRVKGGELFERISCKEYRLTEDKCRMFAQQVKSHNNRKSKEGRNISFWEILTINSPRQVVSGIVFMHDNDIIHLDIKPNNIVCVSRWERKSIEEKQHTYDTYVGGLKINQREIITYF